MDITERGAIMDLELCVMGFIAIFCGLKVIFDWGILWERIFETSPRKEGRFTPYEVICIMIC